MARSIENDFYRKKQWIQTRDSYMAFKHRLCETCLEQGIMSVAVAVHHIIPLNESNYTDPEIAYGWDNLRCLCASHHALVHRGVGMLRDDLMFDENFNIIKK